MQLVHGKLIIQVADFVFAAQEGQKVDFKNVQRRVYDALNVLSAMGIIRKDKYNIIYIKDNEHVPEDFGIDSSDEDDENHKTGEGADGTGGQTGDYLLKQLQPDMIEKREQEVNEMRHRIREKQKLFLELIK